MKQKHTEQTWEKPLWLKMTLEEVETLAEKLAKEGHTAEKIGLILRDQYGIPTTKVFGKKLGKILQEKGLQNNADTVNIEKKFQRIKKHLEKHHKDNKSKRALAIRTGRVRNLNAYASRKASAEMQ